MKFKQDRLENEKNDPIEASSLKFINIPIVLLALFIGFGATYLALRTNSTSMTPGDSRTTPNIATVNESNPSYAGTMDKSVLMEKGKQVFTTNCQACHQATGTGIPGLFPPLAESEWVNGPPKQVVAIILHGILGEITVKGEMFQGVMPPFKDQLKSDDIAAVATYIRNSFGNNSDLVSVERVDEVKEETKSRTTPWGGQAELSARKWK